MSTFRWSRFRILPPDPEVGWMPFAWLIYFPSLFMWPAFAHASTNVWIATIASAIVFLPLYFRAYWCSTREKYWIIGAIAALGMILAPFNPSGAVFTIYAASFAGAVRPSRRSALLILAVAGTAATETLVLQLSIAVWAWQIPISLVIGFTSSHFAKVREMNSRLRHANDEIAHLAKLAERERIARDLHDLLGHTLSLITLKASLASRLADRDPARAVEEIKDVERISRDALTEVRAAVAGYRDTGLANQVASAESMLRAAGIDMYARIDAIQLSPAEEAVLSLILREAVTNVVRHAKATRCEVTLTSVDDVRTLCIEDDGHGKTDPDGNGITGMRERMALLGGTISIDSSEGTRVSVTLAPIGHGNDLPARLSITA